MTIQIPQLVQPTPVYMMPILSGIEMESDSLVVPSAITAHSTVSAPPALLTPAISIDEQLNQLLEETDALFQQDTLNFDTLDFGHNFISPFDQSDDSAYSTNSYLFSPISHEEQPLLFQ